MEKCFRKTIFALLRYFLFANDRERDPQSDNGFNRVHSDSFSSWRVAKVKPRHGFNDKIFTSLHRNTKNVTWTLNIHLSGGFPKNSFACFNSALRDLMSKISMIKCVRHWLDCSRHLPESWSKAVDKYQTTGSIKIFRTSFALANLYSNIEAAEYY